MGGWENSLLEQLITSGNRDHAFLRCGCGGASQQGREEKSEEGQAGRCGANHGMSIDWRRALESCPVFYFYEYFFGVTFPAKGQ